MPPSRAIEQARRRKRLSRRYERDHKGERSIRSSRKRDPDSIPSGYFDRLARRRSVQSELPPTTKRCRSRYTTQRTTELASISCWESCRRIFGLAKSNGGERRKEGEGNGKCLRSARPR